VVRSDVEAVKLFNACVGLVWAFRDIHVTFSALYIGACVQACSAIADCE
jgi:hypothetical protein